MPVVELVVVVHMGKGVVLRAGLQRHEDIVVGPFEAAGKHLLLPVLGHQSDRIDPIASRLGPVTVEWDAQFEDLAGPNQRRGSRHTLGRDEIRGPPLVVGAPATPVAHPSAQLSHIGYGRGHPASSGTRTKYDVTVMSTMRIVTSSTPGVNTGPTEGSEPAGR